MGQDQQRIMFILLALAVGWIFNLGKVIIYALDGGVTFTNTMYMLRLTGVIIPPFGGILGYIPNW